jgi:excisionase family DNA binding protein
MLAKELLTPDEAASILKVTKRTILRWARERKIESVRVSIKGILFTAS